MSIDIRLQAKTKAILEREALHYGVGATAVAKAILDTVVREGLVHTMLVGVDLDSYRGRRRGRPKMKGAAR